MPLVSLAHSNPRLDQARALPAKMSPIRRPEAQMRTNVFVTSATPITHQSHAWRVQRELTKSQLDQCHAPHANLESMESLLGQINPQLALVALEIRPLIQPALLCLNAYVSQGILAQMEDSVQLADWVHTNRSMALDLARFAVRESLAAFLGLFPKSLASLVLLLQLLLQGHRARSSAPVLLDSL